MHGGFDAYKGKFEALLSAHYIAAVVLHERTLSLAEFEPDRYDDANLRQFAAGNVEIHADASLSNAQAAVEIETVDGAVLAARCEHPLGAYENPLSRAQVEQKFRTYAQGQLPDPLIDEVIGAVADLENFASVRTLMDRLRVPPRAARPAIAAAE
jgi:2-methylcitrate dehydratase PrpD